MFRRVAKTIVRLGSAPYESKSHWNRDKLSLENHRFRREAKKLKKMEKGMCS